MTMTTESAPTPEPAEPLWLTATLRPVGVLTGATIDRLADELSAPIQAAIPGATSFGLRLDERARSSGIR